jgi:hypothetical protein
MATISIHKSLLAIFLFVLVMIPPLFYNDNENHKVMDFLVIFIIITTISPVILREQVSLKIFLKSLSVISFGLVVLVLFGFAVINESGRLTLYGGNPIGLGRAVSITGLYMLILLLHNKIRMLQFLIIMAPTLYVLLFTGSKGPAISMVLAVLIIYLEDIKRILVRNVFYRISSFILMGIITVSVYFHLKPNSPLERLFNPEYDNSTAIRTRIYWDSFKIISENPNGIGLGNFKNYSYTEYPHNILLETFVELGWLVGSIFVILLIFSFIGLKYMSKQSLYHQMIFGLFIMSFLNSMVTGDLTSPKELYVLIPLGINSFFIMWRKNKSNKQIQVELTNPINRIT